MTELWDGQERRKSDTLLQELREIHLIQVQQSTDLKDLTRFLTGNGSPEKGMVVRLDRIEQWRDDMNLHRRSLWTISVGMVLKTVWDALTRSR